MLLDQLKDFPQLSTYPEGWLRDALGGICRAEGLPETEENMLKFAGILESDLQHMFSSGD